MRMAAFFAHQFTRQAKVQTVRTFRENIPRCYNMIDQYMHLRNPLLIYLLSISLLSYECKLTDRINVFYYIFTNLKISFDMHY